MPRALAAAVAAVFLNGTIAATHHSIAGVYDAARQVRLEGTVAAFQFVSPHPFLEIDVRRGSGSVERWRLEMDNRSELSAVGITADTLKPGDRVTVRGSAARSGVPSLYVRELARPADGFLYEQVGSSPRVRLPAR